jgi:excisionase family DNA binding protein
MTATTWSTSAEACRALGVERKTLIKWADEGHIRCLRPGGTGNRKFDIASVLPEARAAPVASAEPAYIVNAIYGRVSTRKQKPYLDTQVAGLLAKYPDYQVFTDVCSGINFRRKGLKALLELAFAGRLRVVRVAHRDRLCRFAFDLLEWLLEKHGAKIIVESDDSDSPERELADDVISIITVFGARLYGSRSKRGKRKRQEEGKDGGGAEAIRDDAAADGGSATSDSLGEDVPDCGPDAGASTLLRGGTLVVQRGGGSGKKRGRPPKQRAPMAEDYEGGAA